MLSKWPYHETTKTLQKWGVSEEYGQIRPKHNICVLFDRVATFCLRRVQGGHLINSPFLKCFILSYVYHLFWTPLSLSSLSSLSLSQFPSSSLHLCLSVSLSLTLILLASLSISLSFSSLPLSLSSPSLLSSPSSFLLLSSSLFILSPSLSLYLFSYSWLFMAMPLWFQEDAKAIEENIWSG